jgi:hypothetical protein
MNFLTDKEHDQLKLQHKQERDGRVRDRIKAILLYDVRDKFRAIGTSQAVA